MIKSDRQLQRNIPDVKQRTITVGLVRENRIIRTALAAMLNTIPDLRVAAWERPDSATLAEAAPDVLLLDEVPASDGTHDVIGTLVKAMPDVKIAVMNVAPESTEIADFVSAGVSGFVLKDATFDEHVETIRAVAAGEKVLPARMTEPLFARLANGGPLGSTARNSKEVHMTRREHDVVALIAAGMCNKEIAQRLNVSTSTVKSHVRNVMDKLSLHTRLQVAAHAHASRN